MMWVRRTLALAGSALLIAACGGSGRPATTASVTSLVDSRVVDIYSSLPLVGPARAEGMAITDGIKLALAQAGGRAGGFTVDYRSLDDATLQAAWDPARTAANARRAATDPRAIYYIGEFNSVASEISYQILNEAGIPQVSPASTYVGLTQSIHNVTAPGEPGIYYPTGTRTFLRIIPPDNVQAAADLLALRSLGCTRVAVAYAKSDGAGLADLLDLEKSYYGMEVTSDTEIDPTSPGFRTYAAGIRSEGAECLAYTGNVGGGATQLAENVHAALPLARILASSDSCNRSWMSGVTAVVAPFLLCTAPTLPVLAWPGGRSFLDAYRKAYRGADPGPYAIFGYEAMKLGLQTIASRGAAGNNRSAVLRAMFAVRGRHSVLGTYGFDAAGDTTLTTYGLYRAGRSGAPVFARPLTPTKVLSGS